MLIGRIATEFGTPVDTLRYYDKIGLLKPKREKGVRQYAPEDVLKLEKIVKMKNLMFSLEEISCLLDMDEKIEEDLNKGKLDIATVERVRQIIWSKYLEINSLEQDLQRVRHYLEGMMSKIEGVMK